MSLTELHPIVKMEIHPATAYAKALTAAGREVPTPIAVDALIDTGFTAGLAIDIGIVQKWKLPIRNFNRVNLTSDGSRYVSAYYAWETDLGAKFLRAAKGRNILIDPMPVTLLDLSQEEGEGIFQAIIGLEVLQACILVYHGPKEGFCLEISPTRFLAVYS